jgi:cytochrome P450
VDAQHENVAAVISKMIRPSRASIASAEFAADPHRYYHAWREGGSVQPMTDGSEWIALSHQAVSRVVRDAAFASAPNREFSAVIHGKDGAEHRDARARIRGLFEQSLLASRRDPVREIARSAAERLPRTFDLVADFTAPVAHLVVCGWLGLHPERAQRIGRRGPTSATWRELEAALLPGGEMDKLLASNKVDRMEAPELAAFLLAAGGDTVRDCVALCVFALLTVGAAGLADETPPARLVQELIRLEPPVHCVVRAACEDVVIDGAEIPEGATVWACIASANRDPEEFENPDAFLPGRPEKSMSFGAGPHACAGRYLGLIETEEMLAAILPKLPLNVDASSLPAWRIAGPGGAPALRRIEKWKIARRT